MDESSANVSAREIGSYSRKGPKKTTNEQFLMLVRELDQFPELMRGQQVVGANKFKLESTWLKLVDKLNAIGPPQKTMSEWKKVYSDLRLRIHKKQVDLNSYLKEPRRSSKKTSFTTDKENSNDPLVPPMRSPKREPDFDISQEPSTSQQTEDEEEAEEEMPFLYPDSPPLINVAPIENISHIHKQQQPTESVNVNKSSPTSESQSFNLLQQQIQNQTMLLDILKNMTNGITSLLERQTAVSEKQLAAAEKQVAATERQAAATEALIQLLKDGDCAEALGNLTKK